ncbi:hypothetical protein EC957_010133 [Mortierella hygrophila]|uniref:Kazal-like domain-containing protein n=1 Tax=Mortierella hygrophila TaxID=979708 RepID=A0A9P6FAC2_9FUNG|nr:hypothetical protein EC957_010133 [Mortierella hygrophila]
MKFSTLITLTVASTLAILSKSDAATPACAGKCPSVIAPVCAQNAAGLTQTWVNSCELAKFNCNAPGNIYTQISNKPCPADEMKKRDIFDGPVPVPGCPQKCPDVISPVCAQNQAGTQKTFVNSCSMSIVNCEYPADQWTQISKGECFNDMSKRSIIACAQKCPDVLSPVCGQDKTGKQATFGNSCRLSVTQCQFPTAGWIQVSTGTCAGDLSKRNVVACAQKCPDVISPVCGQDKTGKQATFGNSCRLSVTQCQFPTAGWTQVSTGTCAADLD